MSLTFPGGVPSTKDRSARLKLATVFGVPVYAHAQILLVGLMIFVISKFALVESVCCTLALAFILLVHELGHMAAAKALGLEVFSIDIHGLGAVCLLRAPRSVRDTLLVFSAGLIAQGALLLATLAVLANVGTPGSTAGRSIAFAFTYLNVAWMAFGLIPMTNPDGVKSDGRVLWQTIRHAITGSAHPFPSPLATTRVFPPETSLLRKEGFAPLGFTSGLEFLNDESTPMDLVINVLMKHLQLDEEGAVRLMLQIHNTGGLLLSMDATKAEATAAAIAADAQAQGHPGFTCRAVAV